ncbi:MULTISPECIES: 3-phenylpropionate/cinnamic acid dioxygenase subunit beta [Mycobacterium]|jgi:3-phenylpropionate/cinnamic acid dioxygenase small subunit|uniref:3-phenylpropionate dioxygenase n=5 Tax=Mycobacterium TaxID=1763 RepID=A0A1X0KM14_MYCSC|nr:MULTISPECIES: 3-phenylpropionate/cinnamic acid dioxygenase subunit beta [Mycobacterium]MBX9639675.1 3-phenylpropionate/cinnamic acid dioxygenase subunit beta [Mycobacteriaceae bacterium]AFC42730.1 3-phenylpropionate dioxygenase subunit beta [Mycobacterium intracellulare ATCC 13950]AFC47830.1 3-phenylpropionate dioxygenase subunit beta [Mycobacterium intracellulare MOTT-02]ASW94596.1 3-phenylpropionate dioxygenase [Mycobacterium intracellulare]ETZ38001.1 iron-sulfur domain protein [Mycobacte
MSTAPDTHSSRSRLGGSASRVTRTGKTLRFDDERHLVAHQWLVDESYLLDAQAYSQWLEVLSEDIHYLMPVRVTTALAAGYDTSPGMAHFDEDKYSLSRRVARFLTEHAWTEDPPSRLRHHLSNVRTFATDDPDHLIVESATLLFRSRGDVREGAFLSAGREDLLRLEGEQWRLARRIISVDESVIRMQNLAVFL